MISRFRRYSDNLGPVTTVMMLLFIAYFTWRISQLGSVLAMVAIGCLGAFCVLLPLAVMPYFIPRGAATSRFLTFARYAIYAVLTNAILNIFPVPYLVSVACLMFIYFYIGFGFWYFSSPRIVTPRGYARYEERMLRQEEAALASEIEMNARVLQGKIEP